MKVEGSVALVTGGANGIGRAICEAILSKKAKVCVADYSDAGQSTAEEFNKMFGDGSAIFVKCDVRKLQDVQDAFAMTVKTFGSVNIVANNAGILDEKNYEDTVNINVTGVMRVLQTALSHMDVSKGGFGGTIINTASLAGLAIGPEFPAYYASKHAVVAYTRCFATPFHYDKHQVRINCLCPGFVNTDIIRWEDGRTYLTKEQQNQQLQEGTIRPEFVAEAFVELAGDDSKCGQAIVLFAGQPPTPYKFAPTKM